MTLDEFRAWFDEASEPLSHFLDFEPTSETEAEWHEVLRKYWFRKNAWNEPGHRFVPLGHDGTGSMACAWILPDSDAVPIVWFGSEGSAGVLATSPVRWAQALTYGPSVREFEGPARLQLEDRWIDEADGEDRAGMEGAMGWYGETVTEAFGPIPPFQELVSGVDDLNADFAIWIETVSARPDDSREDLEAGGGAGGSVGDAATDVSATVVLSRSNWGLQRVLDALGTPVNWSPWIVVVFLVRRLPSELLLFGLAGFVPIWLPMIYFLTPSNHASPTELVLDDTGLRLGSQRWSLDALSWVDVSGEKLRVMAGGTTHDFPIWTDGMAGLRDAEVAAVLVQEALKARKA